MDRDFDGKLSFEEFMGEETALERLFKSMDSNGDGNITKEVTSLNQMIKRITKFLNLRSLYQFVRIFHNNRYISHIHLLVVCLW